jgi:TatD DNase family protein
VDTHCHLDFDWFDEDRQDVVKRAVDAGVKSIIVPGLDVITSRFAIDVAERFDVVYAAVGIHPNSIGFNPDSIGEVISEIELLVEHPKVVAIGEIGLDYHWDKTPPDLQQQWLRAQLDLAADVEKPVILHNRDSTEDILSVLSEWVGGGLPNSLVKNPGVMHSFSGTWDDAQPALNLGFYLGFTGPITFKKANELRRVAAKANADRILIETDSPFLTPHPHRGKRNEPANVRFVAEKLAEVRGLELLEAANLTTLNARRLFCLKT